MNRIKELREEMGLSQEELARKINISQQSISFYESGTRDPSIDTLFYFSRLFNCSIDYILGLSNVRGVKTVAFANHNGIDISGLTKEEIEEIKKQVEYLKWKKKNGT